MAQAVASTHQESSAGAEGRSGRFNTPRTRFNFCFNTPRTRFNFFYCIRHIIPAEVLNL
jgi:hypothetical protein